MPTLADAESALKDPLRLGAAFSIAGVSLAGGSPLPVLAGPIGRSLAFCGVRPANPAAPSDDDLARLAPDDWWKFLDVATYLALAGAAVALTAGGQSVSWDDFSVTAGGSAYAAALKRFADLVRNEWGFGNATLQGGSVRVRDAPGWGEFSGGYWRGY